MVWELAVPRLVKISLRAAALSLQLAKLIENLHPVARNRAKLLASWHMLVAPLVVIALIINAGTVASE